MVKTTSKKGSKKMTRAVFNVDEDTLFRFKMQALKERKTMTEIFTMLVKDYLKKTEGSKDE